MDQISVCRTEDRAKPTGTAQRVLEEASCLFYRRGITRTTVADIADRTGILKGSLYYHFDSRQAILDAYLARALDLRLAWLEQRCRGAGTPRNQLLNLVDAAVASIGHERFRGCPFLNAVAELPDDPAVAERSRAARAETLSFLAERFAAAGARDPEDAAEALLGVLYGMLAAVQLGAPAATSRGRIDARAVVLDRCATTPRARGVAAAA